MSDPRLLTAEDLLAGTATVHEVAVPPHVLRPRESPERPGALR